MEVADRTIGEALGLRLIALEFGEAVDAMALETAVQRRSGEMRHARL